MRQIEYPITVTKIESDFDNRFSLTEAGCFVSVRPCGEEYKGKTYLGLLLGDMIAGAFISHNPSTGVLKIISHQNPAIFVFDLNKVVFGCESWWSKIRTEDDLAAITDKDINDQWYVKALRSLAEKENTAN